MLGDPRLRVICEPVAQHEIGSLEAQIKKMYELIQLFRKKHKFGRAIAAPQIGLMKRLIVIDTGQPLAMFNPVLSDLSDDTFILWDDCMSFPNLLVRLQRHRSCRVSYRNDQWVEIAEHHSNDLSELLQHECDHLDGILAVDHVLDQDSLKWRWTAE